MDLEPLALAPYGAAAIAAGFLAHKARARLELSLGKHASLAGHPRMARRLARLIGDYAFAAEDFFASDGAPPDVVARRKAGFDTLAADYAQRFPRTAALKAQTIGSIPDLLFTDSYRVPFPYRGLVRARLGGGVFVAASHGTTLADVDGNLFHDLAGSYGVNLLGYDAYKGFIREAVGEADALGPVLGAYHPVVAENVERLKAISGLDAVSFHMSGTEAVMQAVRLARYHTGRSHVVRFCGAYHGWWGDVQPGVGNPEPHGATYTLADMSDRALRVLRRRRDIACVLVNPVQALHPNVQAPGDSGLFGSGRAAGFDRAAYAAWLARLREVCTERGIVLILDEVFLGFRLARGGAQEYFSVRADMVTYGKTLGGGLPVGVVCGKAALMRRFRDDRPADICFARGTFNAHPYVMAAMRQFLLRFDAPEVRALYEGLDATWRARARRLNAALEARGLPVRVAAMSTVWTVLYERPSRYNWMLQYYLRAAGLALSWVGTGRLIFSLNHDETSFAEVEARFVSAAAAMMRDGWWWEDPALPPAARAKALARRLRGELLRAALRRIARR
jgi:glutamate-1-semialdehyde 2,1-aminomutase